MNVKIQVALIGIFGGLVGGAFTSVAGYFLGLEATRQELLQEVRSEAYVDWLNVRLLKLQAEQVKKGDDSEAVRLTEKFKLEGRQAIGRVGVYGDRRVVGVLSAWLLASNQKKPCTFSTWTQEIELFQSMRATLFPKEDRISDDDLSVILFGCREPNQRN